MAKLHCFGSVITCFIIVAVLVCGTLAEEEVCHTNVERACASSSLSGKWQREPITNQSSNQLDPKKVDISLAFAS